MEFFFEWSCSEGANRAKKKSSILPLVHIPICFALFLPFYRDHCELFSNTCTSPTYLLQILMMYSTEILVMTFIEMAFYLIFFFNITETKQCKRAIFWHLTNNEFIFRYDVHSKLYNSHVKGTFTMCNCMHTHMQSVRTTYVECRCKMSKQTSMFYTFVTGWVKNLSKNLG